MKQFNQILYLDDDPDDGALLEYAIRELFVDKFFYYFESPKKFFMFLNNNSTLLKPIVFIDLNMPAKNGFECIREIRSTAGMNQLPVIVYTTSKRPEDIERSYAAGANLYVRKPFSFTEIREVFLKLFDLDWNHYHPLPPFGDFYLE